MCWSPGWPRSEEMLGQQLRADYVHYTELDAAGDVHVRAQYSPGRPPFPGTYPRHTVGQGLTLVISDGNSCDLDQATRAGWLSEGVRAVVEAPLVRDGRWFGQLVVLQGRPREWTQDEVFLVEETAARTWAFVERARAEAATRELSIRLAEQLRALTEAAVQTVRSTDAEGPGTPA